MKRLPLFALTLALAAPAVAAEPPASGARPKKATRGQIVRGPRKPADGPLRPVNITSQFFEVQPDTQQATWKGNVIVERDDVRVRCDRLVADYDESRRLRRLTCQGGVHMQQPAREPVREAWGQHAVFDNASGMLTVSGEPRARDGVNTMNGSKVVFFVEENRLQVENAVMVLESDAPPAGAAPKAKGGGGSR